MEAFHPRPPIRRVDRIVFAVSLQHVVRTEKNVVERPVHRDSGVVERARHALVARDRIGVVVAIGVDGTGAGAACEQRQLLRGVAFEHGKIGAQRAHARTQLAQAVEEELHDRRADARAAEQLGIEDERADHALALACGAIERDVIVQPQVAAHPDERNRMTHPCIVTRDGGLLLRNASA